MVTQDPLDGARAPGVVFAYDTAKWQIEKQEESIREVNARLGFVIAGVIAFATWYFKDVTDPRLAIGVGLPLFVTALLACVGYLPRVYYRPTNPHGITSDAKNKPGRIKELALQNMLDAYDANGKVIVTKNWFFTYALYAGVLTVLVGIGVKVGANVVGLTHVGGTTAAARRCRAVSDVKCRSEIRARGNGLAKVHPATTGKPNQ